MKIVICDGSRKRRVRPLSCSKACYQGRDTLRFVKAATSLSAMEKEPRMRITRDNCVNGSDGLRGRGPASGEQQRTAAPHPVSERHS